jgi:hypothetical protein
MKVVSFTPHPIHRPFRTRRTGGHVGTRGRLDSTAKKRTSALARNRIPECQYICYTGCFNPAPSSCSGSGYFATDGQSASLSPHLGPMTIVLLLLDICGLHVEGRPPWREDGSVIYLYNLLALRSKSAELMTISYCLIWDYMLLSNTRLPQPGGRGPCIYIPQKQDGPVIPPGNGFSFCRLLRLAGLRWRWLKEHIFKQQSSHCVAWWWPWIYSRVADLADPISSITSALLYNYILFLAWQWHNTATLQMTWSRIAAAELWSKLLVVGTELINLLPPHRHSAY